MSNSVEKTVSAAYDAWATTYDSCENKTRDLDTLALHSHVQTWDMQGKDILEVGCGSGRHTKWMLGAHGDKMKSLTAMDISQGMLDEANAKLKGMSGYDKVGLCQHNISEAWPQQTNSVDIAYEDLVLEHLPQLSFFFKESFRVLRQDGLLFICEYHPFRQYKGGKAGTNSSVGEVMAAPPCFNHDLSEFINEAFKVGFNLKTIREWRDPNHEDTKPPRLVSMEFGKK